MRKEYIVCLCFGREKCETITSEIAKRNNAIDYIVEPVIAPMCFEFAYRGKIVKEVDDT